MNNRRRHSGIWCLLCLLLVSASSVSCNISIWEVREHCPSWLSFDFTPSESVADSVTLMLDDRVGPVTGAEFTFHKPYSHTEFEVEKGFVEVVAFSGQEKAYRTGTMITTPLGEQADSLFVQSAVVDCTGEFAHMDVELRKQWVTVYLTINDLNQTKTQVQYDDFKVEVVSNINGIDMNGLSDIEGQFRYLPEMDADGKAVFRIYRQTNASENLHLNIYKGSTLVDRMPLGKELSSGGLDWTAESLDDASVNVRILTGDITILVIPWKDQGHDHIEF